MMERSHWSGSDTVLRPWPDELVGRAPRRRRWKRGGSFFRFAMVQPCGGRFSHREEDYAVMASSRELSESVKPVTMNFVSKGEVRQRVQKIARDSSEEPLASQKIF